VLATVPADATVGSHRIVGRGPAGTGAVAESAVAIAVVRGGGLPRTGNDTGDMVRLAVFAVGLGGLLVGVTYRRRRIASASASRASEAMRRALGE
jgi:hypothetical protein